MPSTNIGQPLMREVSAVCCGRSTTTSWPSTSAGRAVNFAKQRWRRQRIALPAYGSLLRRFVTRRTLLEIHDERMPSRKRGCAPSSACKWMAVLRGRVECEFERSQSARVFPVVDRARQYLQKNFRRRGWLPGSRLSRAKSPSPGLLQEKSCPRPACDEVGYSGVMAQRPFGNSLQCKNPARRKSGRTEHRPPLF